MRTALVYLGMLLIPALASWLAKTDRAYAEIIMVDAVGRPVKLAASAKRIVTNESLLLVTLALLDDNPVTRLPGCTMCPPR